jgi:hypothetical protein
VSFTEGSSENDVCIAEVHRVPLMSPGKSGYRDFLPHQPALNNSYLSYKSVSCDLFT